MRKARTKRVLHATQVVLEEKLAAADYWSGRPSVVEARNQAVRPRHQGRPRNFDLVNSRGRFRAIDPMFSPISTSPAATAWTPRCCAQPWYATNATVIAALAVVRGESRRHDLRSRRPLHEPILAPTCARDRRLSFRGRERFFAALVADDHQQGRLFHCGYPRLRTEPERRRTRGNGGPWPRSMSSASISSPKIAFVSHFRLRQVMIHRLPRARCAGQTALLKQNHPEIEADGEMQGDTALSEAAEEADPPALEAAR